MKRALNTPEATERLCNTYGFSCAPSDEVRGDVQAQVNRSFETPLRTS